LHPRSFEYVRAETVADAVEALGAASGEGRAIAGGQSLIPMMCLGLAVPDLVVDIDRLDLAGSERRDGRLVIGALTRHRELERSGELRDVLPLAAEAARYIGNPRVRNRGTLGGSLCHADPAAELAAVTLTYGGEIAIAGPSGERSVAIGNFFHGFFTTAVAPGELLVRVELELPPRTTGHGFSEIANRADDFATAAATALVTVTEDGTFADARLALAGVADRPIRFERAGELCRGEVLSEQVLARVRRAVVGSVEPRADGFTSPEYRAEAAGICAARALDSAWRRARGEAE
jgi:CO/xanthine dehydrogenase FAD-binding subunit